MRQLAARAALVVFAAGFFGAAVWAALAVQDARAITNCDTATASNDAAELTVLQLVNDARAQAGLGPLAVSPSLNRMAAWKSEDSSNQPPLSHTDSLDRSPYGRAVDCGYGTGAAENIAYGYASAQATFTAWMGSPGHRANILNPGYRAIGAGHSGNSWVLNFGFVVDGGGSVPAPPTSTPAVPANTPLPTQAPQQPTAIPSQPQPTTPARNAAPAQQPTEATPPAAVPPPAPRHAAADTSGGQLAQGLNLVTYSGPSRVIEQALGSLGSNVEWVYTWDGSQWLRYFPGQPPYVNTLKTLEPGTAYFIAMRGAATWGY